MCVHATERHHHEWHSNSQPQNNNGALLAEVKALLSDELSTFEATLKASIKDELDTYDIHLCIAA